VPISCSGKTSENSASTSPENQSAGQVETATPAGEALAAAESASEKSSNKKAPEEEEKPELNVLQLGAPAPELSLVDINGDYVKLGEYRGRPLVISFWDPACTVCINQMEILQEEIHKLDANVAFLAVTLGKTMAERQKATDKLTETGLDSARPAFDPEGRTSTVYSVMGIPYFVLVDADGILQVGISGLVKRKFATMTFIDMVKKVANGGDVSACELAQHETPEKYKKLIGKQAPSFRGVDFDGVEQASSFYRGFSHMLIVFWSPTCPHCRRELPRIELFGREFAEKHNVRIIGIVSMPEKDKAEKYLEAAKKILEYDGVTFPNVPDYGQLFMDAYKVDGVPSMFIVGLDGNIEEAFSGEFLFTAEVLDCMFSEME